MCLIFLVNNIAPCSCPPTPTVPSNPVLPSPGFVGNWVLLTPIGIKGKETEKCPSNRTISMGGSLKLREGSAHLLRHRREKLCQESKRAAHFSECLKNPIMQCEETDGDRWAGSELPSECIQKREVRWLFTATTLVGENDTKDRRGPEDKHVLTLTKHWLWTPLPGTTLSVPPEPPATNSSRKSLPITSKEPRLSSCTSHPTVLVLLGNFP